MSSNEQQALIQRTVIRTLQALGIESGLISYNKAQALYGKPFREAVRKGEIRPVCVGEGVNGTKTYSIDEILSKGIIIK